MASSRLFVALFVLLAGAGPGWAAAGDPPTVEGIVARARAAMTPDVAALDKIRTLRLEFTVADAQGQAINTSFLTLATGGRRLQSTADPDRGFEAAFCAGPLDGWALLKPDALAPRSLRALPYEEYRALRDMARDDLAFFAIPAPAVGRATYLGPSEVAGRKTLAVAYDYVSGFKITRFFDADSHALVASDQVTPRGEQQRQLIVSFARTDGIAFPSKEVIFIDGKKSGEVTYARIWVNPDLPPNLFAFPNF